MRNAVFVCLLVGLSFAGCRGCEPAPAASGGDKSTSLPPPAAAASAAKKLGVLIGSVRLAPGQSLPAYPPEAMERKVLTHIERGTFPTVCSPPKQTDRVPVRMTPDGKLIGVMVTASDFSKNPERAPEVHEVTIKDCRLTPRFVVGMKGDTLRVRNEVNFPFMPALGATSLIETLMPTQTDDIPLDKQGVSALLCGFTAPCGRTDVVVMLHPLYAVTDEQGNFKIEGFPADETVHVNAWHPLFDAQEQSVRVESGEQKTLDFVIGPLAGAPAAQGTANGPVTPTATTPTPATTPAPAK